mmetsp:Transcript_11240/g.30069  ORF Transcript_11240/g.30069 Transcript_11240/m.30069 type:complete len:205 (-) Transcript_11240:2680-3294(-)
MGIVSRTIDQEVQIPALHIRPHDLRVSARIGHERMDSRRLSLSRREAAVSITSEEKLLASRNAQSHMALVDTIAAPLHGLHFRPTAPGATDVDRLPDGHLPGEVHPRQVHLQHLAGTTQSLAADIGPRIGATEAKGGDASMAFAETRVDCLRGKVRGETFRGDIRVEPVEMNIRRHCLHGDEEDALGEARNARGCLAVASIALV